MAAAALEFVGPGATVADLERRFSAEGADLRSGTGTALLAELESLGLIRVARGAPAPEYVLTSLGQRLVDRESWTDAAMPLKDLERMRTDFLSVIAHELRTPITVMRTLSGLLLDPSSEPTDEQRRTMLETIERNAERMQDLIGEVLDLARYRSGTISLQLRQFDATRARRLVRRHHQAAGRAAPPVGRAPGPAGAGSARVRRPATARPGAAEPRRQRPAVRARRGPCRGPPPADPGRAVRWSVTDDGPGISTEDQAHLFERFFVGRRGSKEAQEGVGLGLPRALAIAQAHGGTIEVRSRLGHGSTFSLVVPAAGPPEEA